MGPPFSDPAPVRRPSRFAAQTGVEAQFDTVMWISASTESASPKGNVETERGERTIVRREWPSSWRKSA
jgi:hypothetical protein